MPVMKIYHTKSLDDFDFERVSNELQTCVKVILNVKKVEVIFAKASHIQWGKDLFVEFGCKKKPDRTAEAINHLISQLRILIDQHMKPSSSDYFLRLVATEEKDLYGV
jgi:hypothetical protein